MKIAGFDVTLLLPNPDARCKYTSFRIVNISTVPAKASTTSAWFFISVYGNCLVSGAYGKYKGIACLSNSNVDLGKFMVKNKKLSRKGVAVFKVSVEQAWEIKLGADMNVQIGLISISDDVFIIGY